MANSQLSSLWHSETEWDNAVHMHDLIAPLMPLYRAKNLVKIGPVVSAENKLTDGNSVACSRGSAYFVKYLRMYWTDFRNLFTMKNERTLLWYAYTLWQSLGMH